MAVYKCKMCSGELDIQEGVSVVECDYCGTKQTVPSAKDENLQGLFNRANTLRIKSEFDKAEKLYEKIIQADETQAEAYWGLILCKYGIEYVEDPATFKRVPTCHRTSYDAVVTDENYKLALQYADVVQKAIYETEAKQIDEIQKGILAIAQNEEPYDVFICYKETDEAGKRTQDSVIANDIYHQLKQEGFKVFYAAITLEDKLGSAYEPIIFAALNSAKVMLAIGTKSAYFNAVWVKNEWSRYLKMMKNDHSKMLIPCYRDMDAYELPEEFAHLQAQDMSKIGFINDIVRGIKKVVVKTTPKEEQKEKSDTVVPTINSSVKNFLDRAYLALEDGQFDKADEFAEKALDIDAKCGEAYFIKLLCEFKKTKWEYLCEKDCLDNPNYEKANRFADESLQEKLAQLAKSYFYSLAISEMDKIHDDDIYEQVMLNLTVADDYKDAKMLIESLEAHKAIQAEEERIRKEKEAEEARIRKEKKAEEARIREEKEDEKERVKSPQILAFRREYEKRSIIKKKIADATYYNDDGSAVYYHTVGLRDNGTVVAVGNNDYGQCEVDSWQDIIAIDCGNGTTIGLKSDGTVVVAGRCNDKKQEVSSWKDIVAISIGTDETIVGLKSNGRVVTTDKYWDTSSWTDIGAIVATESHIVGLKIDGTVVAVGFNDCGQCDVSAWNDIVDIIAEYGITVGLKSDGTIVAVGHSTDYQLSDLSSWADIVSISIGADALIGLRLDGTVIAVGNNENGQCDVGSWKDIIAIDSKYGTTLGLKTDGTVVAVGYNGEAQCAVSSLRNIVEVWNIGSTVALKKDGSLLLVGEGMPKEEAETILGWELFSDSTKLAKNEKVVKESLKAMQQKYKLIKEKRLQEEKESQMQRYRAVGVCQHCGGTFKGLFTKTCSSCGKKKDY